jgi:hypothetical protein
MIVEEFMIIFTLGATFGAFVELLLISIINLFEGSML